MCMPAGGWLGDVHKDGKANQVYICGYCVVAGSVIFQICNYDTIFDTIFFYKHNKACWGCRPTQSEV